MRTTLIDLTRHCIWADSALWDAVEAHPAARDDRGLLDRFHHIHLVQYAFVNLVRGEPVDPKKGVGLPGPTLREWGRRNAATLLELVGQLTDSELTTHFDVPWFRDPQIELSRGEAILQACLHSVHHRAQNAVRLRELAGESPMIDYIYWIWKGRPEAP